MQITLIRENEILTQILPQKIVGQFTIYGQVGNEQTKITSIEAVNEKWILKSSNEVQIVNSNKEHVKSCVLIENTFQTIIIKKNNEKALVFIEPVTSDRTLYRKVMFPHKCCIKIGREINNDIIYSNKYTTSKHAHIICEDNKITLMDLGSLNGTYVNGKKIKNVELHIGDIVYIMGLKIIIGKGFIAANNPDGFVSFNYNLFSKWIRQVGITDDTDEFEDNEDESNKNIFYRSPRFKRDIKASVMNIDPPPALSNNDDTPLMLLLGPSMTMGMASLFTGIFTINTVISSGGKISSAMPTLVMSMSMLLGTVLWPIITKRYEKKRKIAREEVRQKKYSEYLDGIRQEIIKVSSYQTGILHENNVTIENCAKRIESRQRNLWERAIGHDDFCTVRLGIGDLPLDAEIKYAERKFTLDDDNLQDAMLKVGEEPKVLKQVPVTMSLLKDSICGIIGQRKIAVAFVKGLIIQLSALQSYDEMKLVFVYDKKESEIWSFTKWFPHVWDNGKTIRFIAADQSDGKELSAYLETVLQTRVDIQENNLSEITPYYVIFACSKSVAEKMEAINQILKNKSKCGFSVVALYDELNSLPKECSKVIELSQDISKIYDRNDITGKYTSFKADIFNLDEDEIALNLANIQLNTLYTPHALPSMLTFLEMYGVGKIEHLNILTRWKENDPSKTLEAPVGVDSMGEIVKLDLHEKYHGPHGLVAGMTGSGKSEFIITYILSLAINYHPNEVAFILIDYKGGGMAKAFENLPHTVGIITNLDGTAVKRSLVSIQSELKRRQAIFNSASKSINVSNIDIYKYQKLYRDGVVSEPLPHLFIISDEFAELKNQQPDFMQQLVSAARIGRSLGVHLILATQKPSGVVDDQIWSNSKFRVCLKVQEKADSMDMLKRPDAAELSVTGRFYLQVGYNELFELGQSAWAGAPYFPSDKLDKHKDESVAVIDNLGKIIKQAAFDKKKSQKSKAAKQIDEITNYLSVLATEEKIKSRPLWLEPIPALIYIDELKKKYNTSGAKYTLNPIVGEVDDPANQRQSIMQLPISEDGNTIVYGVSGSGKTTFITTMIYSLISEHTPEEVNLYLLDFGSETLKVFRKVPHVGDVLLTDENEKIRNLFKILLSEMNSRRKMFSDFGGDYDTYLKSSEEKLASIVVVIQNYSAFSEAHEDEEETLNVLTREGTKYGIYFVITAASTNAVRYRMLQNFKQLIVLQLNDTSEYSGILGGTDGVYPSKYPGRGIVKTDKVYEFQTANITRDETIRESICHFYVESSNVVMNKHIMDVPSLPDVVDAHYLANFIKDCDEATCPIGVDKSSLDVAYYNFDNSYINLVLSQNAVNVAFLSGLAEIASLKDKTDVIVLDGDGRMYSNDRYCCVSESTLLNQKVADLFNTLVERNNTTKDSQEKGEELPQFPMVICIINSFINLNIKLTKDSQDKLNILLEKGEASYNVFFFISETSPNLASYANRNWYTRHITLKDWIWVGNGISNRYQLDITQTENDFQDIIGDDFGYVLDNGKSTLIKLLTLTGNQGEVGYDR